MNNTLDKIRDARGTFYGAMNNRLNAGVFRQGGGWYLDAFEPAGYHKFVAEADGAGFERLRGRASTANWDVKPFTITTDTWIKAIDIPRDTFDSAETILGLPFTQSLSARGEEWATLPDRVFTKLLTDGQNAANVSLLGTPFFDTDAPIPNSNNLTLNNTFTVKTNDKTGWRNAFYGIRKVFSKMQRPNGERYHSSLGKLVIMHPTSLSEQIESAFGFNVDAAAEANPIKNRVILIENSLMDDGADTRVWVKPETISWMPLIWVKKQMQPRMEDNIPRGGSGAVEKELQLTQKYTMSVSGEAEGGYGIPYSIVEGRLA